MRIRLHDRGYKAMCRLVDLRDNHSCIICGNQEVQHHHVVFRSHGGSDTLWNLVCLCPSCHSIYAHGEHEKYWAQQFTEYLESDKCRTFEEGNKNEIKRIITKYRR